MREKYKRLLDFSICVLLFKGALLMPVTIFTFARAYMKGERTPMAGVVSCVAGTYAFAMACVAIFIRKNMD